MVTCADIWARADELGARERTADRLTVDVASPDGAVAITLFPYDVFEQAAVLLVARVGPRAALAEFEAMRLGDRLDGTLASTDDDWLLRLVLPCAALDWELLVRSIALLVGEVAVVRRSIAHIATSCFGYLGP